MYIHYTPLTAETLQLDDSAKEINCSQTIAPTFPPDLVKRGRYPAGPIQLSDNPIQLPDAVGVPCKYRVDCRNCIWKLGRSNFIFPAEMRAGRFLLSPGSCNRQIQLRDHVDCTGSKEKRIASLLIPLPPTFFPRFFPPSWGEFNETPLFIIRGKNSIVFPAEAGASERASIDFLNRLFSRALKLLSAAKEGK